MIRLILSAVIFLALLLCGCAAPEPAASAPAPAEAEILEGPALEAQFTALPESNPAEETPQPAETAPGGAPEPGTFEQVAGTVTVEGETAAVTLTRYHSALFYTIDYDPDRFTFSSENGVDCYRTGIPVGGTLPYAVLSVRDEWDRTQEETVDGLIAQFGITGPAESVHIGTGAYPATKLTRLESVSSGSRVVSYYVVSLNENVLVFETACLAEAAEGHGARLQAMLDSVTF